MIIFGSGFPELLMSNVGDIIDSVNDSISTSILSYLIIYCTEFGFFGELEHWLSSIMLSNYLSVVFQAFQLLLTITSFIIFWDTIQRSWSESKVPRNVVVKQLCSFFKIKFSDSLERQAFGGVVKRKLVTSSYLLLQFY